MTLVGPDQHDRQLEYARTHPAVATKPGPRVGQRCIYMSAVTEDAVGRLAALCRTGPQGWWTILFSADLNQSVPGGDYHVTDEQISLLRKAGAQLASWCDCDQTPYKAAVDLAYDRRLDYASGQAENVTQYLNAVSARLLIGNPAELAATPAVFQHLKERVDAREVAFVGEAIHPDPAYSAQGLNIASVCFYIDNDQNQGGYQPLTVFSLMPAGLRRACSIYTGGRASQADLDLYAQWTKP